MRGEVVCGEWMRARSGGKEGGLVWGGMDSVRGRGAKLYGNVMFFDVQPFHSFTRTNKWIDAFTGWKCQFGRRGEACLVFFGWVETPKFESSWAHVLPHVSHAVHAWLSLVQQVLKNFAVCSVRTFREVRVHVKFGFRNCRFYCASVSWFLCPRQRLCIGTLVFTCLVACFNTLCPLVSKLRSASECFERCCALSAPMFLVNTLEPFGKENGYLVLAAPGQEEAGGARKVSILR